MKSVEMFSFDKKNELQSVMKMNLAKNLTGTHEELCAQVRSLIKRNFPSTSKPYLATWKEDGIPVGFLEVAE